MPRAGAYTVSDLPRDRLCRIACDHCNRAGAYRRETLLARFGDAALPDLLIALAASLTRDVVVRLGSLRPLEQIAERTQSI